MKASKKTLMPEDKRRLYGLAGVIEKLSASTQSLVRRVMKREAYEHKRKTSDITLMRFALECSTARKQLRRATARSVADFNKILGTRARIPQYRASTHSGEKLRRKGRLVGMSKRESRQYKSRTSKTHSMGIC